MSIEATLARVSVIRQELADPALMIGSRAALTGGTEAPAASGGSSFATALEQAGEQTQASSAAMLADPNAADAGLNSAAAVMSPFSLAGLNGVAGSGLASPPGSSNPIVAIAESQLGQSEQPPGSNESPAIAEYRRATAGAMPGEPWCAYFASWAAHQAGEPIGSQGQGLGSVGEIWSWAQSSGRAVVNGPGVVPKPGDLIVFGDEHVGIVRGVLPSGQIQTIEGNYENKVAANVRSASEATGYVSMS
jgi:CHAP domain